MLREALAGERAWLVGGALRDRAAGPPDARPRRRRRRRRRAAPRAASGRGAGGASFELSDQFGAWRVVARDRSWQVDITPLQGGSLEADLAARDLTVNAMAEPLAGGELVDPHGGASDLDRKRLRMVSADAFAADPAAHAARRAPGHRARLRDRPRHRGRGPRARAGAGRHRPGARLHRAAPRSCGADAAVRGLALMDELELVAAVLPELAALRGVEQNPYHHRDVHGHTLEVLQASIDLERDPAAALGDEALAAPVRALLAEPLADELTRGGALRFGALLHDIAKPQTRTELPRRSHRLSPPRRAGRRDGARRAGAPARQRAAALARGGADAPSPAPGLPRPRACRSTATSSTATCEDRAGRGRRHAAVSVADRLATRGRKADEAIARHLELAREVLAEALARRAAGPQPPLVRGDELAAELGIARGPELGELMTQIAEARFAGEVSTREEALALAKAARGAR